MHWGEPGDCVIWLVISGPTRASTLFAQMTSQSASTRTKWVTYLMAIRAIQDAESPRKAAPIVLPGVNLIRDVRVTQ